VAFTITHKPNFKDDTNARTIHKLRTKRTQLNQHIKNSWRQRCWDETEQENLTICPLCTSIDKKVEESPAHLLGECKALEKVQEEALLRITNNLDQHFTPLISICMWIGDDQKAAILLGLAGPLIGQETNDSYNRGTPGPPSHRLWIYTQPMLLTWVGVAMGWTTHIAWVDTQEIHAVS